MIELIKTKQYRRLIICFAALDGAQLYMLTILWGWFTERGSRDGAEIAFIIYSAVIAITLLAVPYIINRKDLLERPKSLAVVVRVSVIAAFASFLIALLPGVAPLFIAETLATIFLFIAHAVCIVCIARELPSYLIGRAVGLVMSFAMLIAYVGNYMPDGDAWVYIESAVYVALLAVAALCFRQGEQAENDEQQDQRGYSRSYIAVFAVAVFCYAIVAGLDDNIRYFVDPEGEHFAFTIEFIFLIGALIYLIAGYITDMFKSLKVIVMTALAAIFITIAPLLFTDVQTVAVFYTVLGKLSVYALWIICIAIPIRYSKRKSNWVGFGYAILYLGMVLTSVLFLFLPEEEYNVAFALIMVFALAALFSVVYLFNYLQKQTVLSQLSQIRRHEAELSQLAVKMSSLESSAVTVDWSMIAEECSLTKREGELLPMIVGTMTAEEIASDIDVSLSTVKFHIRNVLKKTECKTRRELRLRIEDGEPNNGLDPDNFSKDS